VRVDRHKYVKTYSVAQKLLDTKCNMLRTRCSRNVFATLYLKYIAESCW